MWVDVEGGARPIVIKIGAHSHLVKACPLCDALERFASIDDDEANAIIFESEMSSWCAPHVRAWLESRNEPTRGRERLRDLFRRASTL